MLVEGSHSNNVDVTNKRAELAPEKLKSITLVQSDYGAVGQSFLKFNCIAARFFSPTAH